MLCSLPRHFLLFRESNWLDYLLSPHTRHRSKEISRCKSLQLYIDETILLEMTDFCWISNFFPWCFRRNYWLSLRRERTSLAPPHSWGRKPRMRHESVALAVFFFFKCPGSLSTFATNTATQLQRVLWQPKPRRKRTSKQAEPRPLLALRRIQHLCVPQIELLCWGGILDGSGTCLHRFR